MHFIMVSLLLLFIVKNLQVYRGVHLITIRSQHHHIYHNNHHHNYPIDCIEHRHETHKGCNRAIGNRHYSLNTF